jgi:2-amino-4-hydroxy-6-hydroxymethyldihydropteridine diphosphokinase
VHAERIEQWEILQSKALNVERFIAYVGIGANLGDKVNNCRQAVENIDQLSECSITACSPLFKTEPDGVTGQEWYVNCVAEVTTTQTPVQLLKDLLSIETRMGRIRTRRWEPRIIDLDLLFFDQAIIKSHNLIVPHPLLHARRFVLEPLARVAPDLTHPVLGLTIRQLLRILPKGPAVAVLHGEELYTGSARCSMTH